MSTTRITTGATEPISIYAVNAAGNPLTGLTDLYVRIRRVSDGFFLDWTGMTFKSTGWTTLNKTLTEASATNAPGVYEVTGGLNTGAITNVTANDDYQVVPLQTPGTTARLPGPGVISVGKWVDHLDANVSTRATQAQILSDATPFQGARIDAAISSRATQAQILSDATPFPGARVDAAISSRAVPGDVQAGLTAQGYTAARAIKLDDLDAAVSSRATQAQILSDATPFQGARIDAAISSRAVPGDVQSGLTAQGYTVARAGNLDNLDAAVTTRATPADVPAGMTTQGYTTGRAPKLDALDANVSTRAVPADVTAGLTAQGYTTIRAPKLDNLDAAISSRSAPGAQMALTTPAVDGVVNALWDEPTSGHVTPGTTGKALLDAGAVSDPLVIAAAVWDKAAASHTSPGTMGQLENRLDAAISTRAEPGDAMALQPNAVDASTLAASGATKVRDTILSDATRFDGAKIDAAISSRASPGAAMDLVSNAVDAASVAATGATKIGGAVWDEALAGHTVPGSAGQAQGRLDALVSSRAAPGATMALTANALDANAVDTTGANKIRDSILSDATRFAGARIDAAISSRAAIGDQMGLSPTAVSAVVAGAWNEPIAGHVTPGTTGKALKDAGITADIPAIVAGVWDEPRAGHVTPGTMGESQEQGSTVAAQVEKIDQAATVAPASAAPGSLLDRLCNKGTGRTFDQTTDSLEAIRDRVG